MRVLGVDPGKHKCGWGVYSANGIGLFGYTTAQGMPFEWDLDGVVIELPQIYTHRGSKGDPNDLIPLAFEAGKVAYRYKRIPVVTRLPAEWKGQVPKTIMQNRLLEQMPDLEQLLSVYTKEQRHNVYDGLMLAMYGYENRERLFR